MSNSSPDSPQRDERIGNLSVTFSSLWARLPGSVFLLQTRGWFLLGPLQWSSQSFPSASSWEFSLLLSYVGSHFLELPWPFLGNFLFCWSTSSSRFLRKGSWQVNVWEPCKCLYSTAALDSLSGYGTWLWKRFFCVLAASLQCLVISRSHKGDVCLSKTYWPVGSVLVILLWSGWFTGGSCQVSLWKSFLLYSSAFLEMSHLIFCLWGISLTASILGAKSGEESVGCYSPKCRRSFNPIS